MYYFLLYNKRTFIIFEVSKFEKSVRYGIFLRVQNIKFKSAVPNTADLSSKTLYHTFNRKSTHTQTYEN